MTRRAALGLSLGFALIAAALRLAAVPAWHGDAQYYVQARIGPVFKGLG